MSHTAQDMGQTAAGVPGRKWQRMSPGPLQTALDMVEALKVPCAQWKRGERVTEAESLG